MIFRGFVRLELLLVLDDDGSCSMSTGNEDDASFPDPILATTPAPQGQLKMSHDRTDDAADTNDATRPRKRQRTEHNSGTAEDEDNDADDHLDPDEVDRKDRSKVWEILRGLIEYLERTSSASPTSPTSTSDDAPMRTYLVHPDLHDGNILFQDDQELNEDCEQGQGTSDGGFEGEDISQLDERINQPVKIKIKALLDWEFSPVFPDELWYSYPPKVQLQFFECMAHYWEPVPTKRNFPMSYLFDPRGNGDEGFSMSLVREALAEEHQRLCLVSEEIANDEDWEICDNDVADRVVIRYQDYCGTSVEQSHHCRGL